MRQAFVGGVLGFLFMAGLAGVMSLYPWGPPSRPLAPNIPLVRTTSGGEVVRWDIKNCLWRSIKTGTIILADGGDKEMPMWRQCRLEQRAKEPKIIWED